jgi:transcriptional regulator with XRE-family HTH domain
MASALREAIRRMPLPIPGDPENRRVMRCEHCYIVQFEPRAGFCVRCGYKMFTAFPNAPEIRMLPKKPRVRQLTIVKELGTRIRLEREAAGISQTDFLRVGIGRSTISRYESGTFCPSVGALERIGEVIGIGTGRLLDGISACLSNDPYIAEIVDYVKALRPEQRQAVIEIVQRLSRSKMPKEVSP